MLASACQHQENKGCRDGQHNLEFHPLRRRLAVKSQLSKACLLYDLVDLVDVVLAFYRKDLFKGVADVVQVNQLAN